MKTIAACTAAIALLASSEVLSAHHSLVNFDTSAPVWVQGTVVRFDRINPHSRIHLERETAEGKIQRWIVDGPATFQLDGMTPPFPKEGDAIEVCGFEGLQSQQAHSGSSTANPPERFMNGHMLVMPDGVKRFWTDYGQLQQCLDPDDPTPLVR